MQLMGWDECEPGGGESVISGFLLSPPIQSKSTGDFPTITLFLNIVTIATFEGFVLTMKVF